MLKVTLFDVNSKLCREWKMAFQGFQNIEIKDVSLDDLDSHDLLVTAGNSLGLMGGGIDYYVNKMCNFKAEALVRAQIQNYWGRLPVGKYVGIYIDKMTKGKFKVLLYAPTMERPRIKNPIKQYI